MRNRDSACRSQCFRQSGLVAIVAIAAASCSDSSRLDAPLFTGSTENQRQIIGNSQPMPPPVSGASVVQYDLPPPGQAAPSVYAESSSPVFALPAGDYRWTPEGVKPAGTVQGASYTPPPAVNNAPPPAVNNTLPPAVSHSAPPAAPSSQNVHTVAAGETLYAIGRRYQVRPGNIAALNKLASPEQIRVGQRLQIPGADMPMVAIAEPPKTNTEPRVAAATASAEAVLKRPPASSQPRSADTAPRVIPGVPSIPVETPPSAPKLAAADPGSIAEPPSANGTSFRWPVRGRIISDFGVKPSGQRNDGINLAVPAGTIVKAAEAGSVIYAGNELDGYGNLVLIQHADGWVSAYAHNSEFRVKRGDQIRRGQPVATAGMSGSVSSPQVHFELRKKTKPVNPLDYLAGA